MFSEIPTDDKEVDVRKSLAVTAMIILALGGSACNEGNDEGGAFDVQLSGAAEVCEGDTCGGEGTGTATIDINSDQNEICYEIQLEGVEGANAAHIHEGAEGESGDVVIDLAYSGEEGESCVAELDEGDLEDVSEEPSNYYVNVHSDQYPDGAVRGQLDT